MSDRWAMVLALSTAAGALVAREVPLWVGVAVAAAALGFRRPALLCLGAAVLASALAFRSWAGLEPPAPGPVAGTATLVSDPVDVGGALRVELRLGGRRVEAWARGRAAARLWPRLAGERVRVAGRLTAVPVRWRARLATRHLAARLNVEEVGPWSRGGAVPRVTNDVRRTLVRGVASLPEDSQALFAGLVLGDDRRQDPLTVDDFRAAGLTHLLAVSGQNVAFVLALAAPLLRGLGLRGRFMAALVVLAGFGVLTRWEPSVLRAEAMAALALLAGTLGRPASTLRLLALAVAGLLLVDPLLVRSVGFQLSCGACAGIAVLSRPLARRLPGPLAVTLAAQVGVAPVLVPVFGGLPVASVPANLLAVPAAGPVMVWGLVAGLPAGLLGGLVAALLHLPTRALVAWVAAVARWATALPLGQLRVPHLLAAAALGGLAALLPRARVPVLALGSAGLVLAAMAGVGGDSTVGGGARLWKSQKATILVVDGVPSPRLLGDLRRAGVRRLDVVVLTSPSRRSAERLAPVLRRHRARLVLTPATARPGTEVTVGELRLGVVATEPRLEVRVARAAPGG